MQTSCKEIDAEENVGPSGIGLHVPLAVLETVRSSTSNKFEETVESAGVNVQCKNSGSQMRTNSGSHAGLMFCWCRK